MSLDGIDEEESARGPRKSSRSSSQDNNSPPVSGGLVGQTINEELSQHSMDIDDEQEDSVSSMNMMCAVQ